MGGVIEDGGFDAIAIALRQRQRDAEIAGARIRAGRSDLIDEMIAADISLPNECEARADG